MPPVRPSRRRFLRCGAALTLAAALPPLADNATDRLAAAWMGADAGAGPRFADADVLSAQAGHRGERGQQRREDRGCGSSPAVSRTTSHSDPLSVDAGRRPGPSGQLHDSRSGAKAAAAQAVAATCFLHASSMMSAVAGSSGIERSESSGKKAAWLASVAGAGSPATQRPK